MRRSLGKFVRVSSLLLYGLTGISPRCGTIYRRIEELVNPQHDGIAEPDQEHHSDNNLEDTVESEDDVITQFRRFQILSLIHMTRCWENCFIPGQRVEMRMIFRR
jgi:hypothetical protein